MVNSSKTKRFKYPFDELVGIDDEYLSEYENDDLEEFTLYRQKNKDDLELSLRTVDKEECTDFKGDDQFCRLFEVFMEARNGSSGLKSSNQELKKSTSESYSRAFRNHILACCHRKVKDFDAMFLLDCETEKNFEIDGRIREGEDLKRQPFTLTVDIVREALDYCLQTKGESSMRGTIVSSCLRAMSFVEMFFTDSKILNVFGNQPWKTVSFAHGTIKTFLNGINVWGCLNKESKNVTSMKKTILNHIDPDRDNKISKEIDKYVDSSRRQDNLDKLLAEDLSSRRWWSWGCPTKTFACESSCSDL